MTTWVNFFHHGLEGRLTSRHVFANDLRTAIAAHDGNEAYHCAFDCVEEELKLEEDTGKRDEKGKVIYEYHAASTTLPYPKTFTKYDGVFRPALGFVWFDFDSHDGGVQALTDARAFVAFLRCDDLFTCYSGSKGFHVGVPFQYFGLQASRDLGAKLNRLAQKLKQIYPSIDTTVFNPQRKFRALGSRHPKTGLFKVRIDLSMSPEQIKELATSRGDLNIPIPELRPPLPHLVALLESVAGAPKPAARGDKKEWTAPTGIAAFAKCGFLTYVKDHPAVVNEPQWYAALSIVSRFQEGRKQCHGISHGHPKYSVTECNDKIDQAEKESAPRTCENISTLWDGCKACPLNGKINSPVNIFDTRFYFTGEKGKLIPDYNLILKHFHDDGAYKTIADMKTVYRFKETHYDEFTPIEIKAFAEEAFEPKPQEKVRQEFYHKCLANFVDRRRFFSETTENCLNFKNGILRLDANLSGPRSLIPHSAIFGFRHVLPYGFDAHAQAPTFQWWINDVMLGDAELIKILQEFTGYVIRGGEYSYHKALWLSGSGRNGKSTFLSVLKALIGAGNYSTLSIRQIINDKFSSADLDGKIANFSEETSPEELSDSGPFKNLTGDGELLAQKKYGDPYSFRNRAKLIMTYNEVPMLKDLSPGMLSRPIIIPWKKDLTDETAQDKNLKSKLMSELPGIFNWALEGWERLERNEGFTQSEKSQLEMDEIRSSSCSAASWFNEAIQLLELDKFQDDTVKPRQLYEAYKLAVGQYAYAENKFYKRINSMTEVAKRRKRTEKGIEYFSMRFRRGSAGPVEF